jgi:hypothetical protein
MLKLTGNEKAFIGGFVAALTAALVQVAQTGQMTWKEAGWSLLVWVLTHATVYLTTNTAATDTPVVAPAATAAPATPANAPANNAAQLSTTAQPVSAGSVVSPSNQNQ